MHYLDESHILIFLLQVLVLLGVARTLSVICESVRIPSLAGEIAAGILLGPTLLGRVSPSFSEWLFPADQIQWTMLDTVSWLGVFFLLLSSGFHVNINHAVRSGRAAMLIGIVGVVVPLGIGYLVFSLLDERYYGENATALSFSLFLAVASSITAISVVARSLNDLSISKTPQGSLALASCAVNDLFGWFLFAVVMSLTGTHARSTAELTISAVAMIAFVFVCTAVGGRVMNWAIRRVESTRLSQPAAAKTLLVSTGLLCGAITQALGIHAILGFFLAGIMVGSADRISQKIRDSVSQTLHAIFVPLFFATLGLKIDFLIGLEIWPTMIFTVVAIGGKFIGAWLGARMGKQSPKLSVLMGLIFTPGGAMEIVVATLALELGLIGQAIFVAIVFAALLSSVLAGPLIGIQARRMKLGRDTG